MWFPWCSRSRHALIKTVFAVGWKQRMGAGGLSVEVWCFADPPSLESLSGSHCHFTDTFVWLLLVVLKVWLVSLFAKNYICFKSKTGWLLKKHICMSSAWSHSMSLTAFTEKWNFFQHILNPKGKIFFFLFTKMFLAVQNISQNCFFTMISFHRKCLSINLKVSQIEEAWSQGTLASAGIFGNCGGNTFFLFVSSAGHGCLSGYCTCGCKTKMWHYLYICMRGCVWRGCRWGGAVCFC